jgi:siroheme synthase
MRGVPSGLGCSSACCIALRTRSYSVSVAFVTATDAQSVMITARRRKRIDVGSAVVSAEDLLLEK